jgi:5'-nucleotidase
MMTGSAPFGVTPSTNRIGMHTQRTATGVGALPARLRVGLIGFVALAMIVGLLPSTASQAQTAGFTDVPASNVHSANIAAMAELGILLGYDDGTFRPRNNITRGQLASVLARAIELESVRPAPFTDTAGHTHEGAIGALAEEGLLLGYPDGTFRPNAPILRDHTAVIISRILDVDPVEDGPFTDVTRYEGRINALYELGIINGTSATTFNPMGNIRRDQTATVVAKMLDVAENGVTLTMLATNDFHGRLAPPAGDLGGAEFLATHMDAVRAQNRNTLYVDAGDLVGATPVLSNLFYDEPTVEAANLLGLDVQTVGNHEFDRGQDEILRRLEGGCFDDDCGYRGGTEFEGSDYFTLSTNVIVDEEDEALTYPWAIADTAGGISVGFIGVTTVNTPEVVSPTGIQGLSFLPEAEAVNATVPELQEEGVDVIVVLMHEGARQDGDENSCDNRRGAAADIVPQFDDAVDVVIEGHTHQSYVCDLEDGPLVTQAFEYGKMFTEIELRVDYWTGEILDRSAENHPVTRDVPRDAAMTELIDHYQELAGPALFEVVGKSTVEIPRTTRSAESAQGNLATDALIDQYAEADIDFAFQNSGGLRADLTRPPEPEEGPPQLDDEGLYNIAREDVLAVWPFGNLVALAEVDGPTLEDILANGVREIGGGRFIQVAGLRIEYSIDASVAPADNNGFPRGVIESVEYWNHPDHADGTPVDLSASATYRIAMNDFMAAGGDGYPVLGDAVFSFQDPLEIAIERYLLENSPVSPAVEGRIVEVPAS